MAAQTAPPCPADRPVDDIIAELNRPKKQPRNKNPLPDTFCVLGWCRQTGKTPPTLPQPAPRAEIPAGAQVSSSQSPAEKCDAAMEMALNAAHDVEVGDLSYERGNYKGAASRYEDGLKEKPGDPAIHVRLGRTLEKLQDLHGAIEHYKAAESLPGPAKWHKEAHDALARLGPEQPPQH